jgi:hypothetical protein
VFSYTKMLGQLHDAGNTTTLAHAGRGGDCSPACPGTPGGPFASGLEPQADGIAIEDFLLAPVDRWIARAP